MDPDPYSHLLSIVLAAAPLPSDCLLFALLIILILLNAVVSGSEVAFFSLGEKGAEDARSGVREKDNPVSQFVENPEKLLASIIIVYNVLNVAIIALVFYLSERFFPFQVNRTMQVALELVFAVSIVLLFVEITPKFLARNNPARFTERFARFIRILNTAMSPFSSLLVHSTNIFSKSFIQRKHEISMDDLSKALEITSNEMAHEQEIDMLEGIIRFKDKTVDDILITRSDMVALDLQTPFREVVHFIIDAGYSRIPVYEENPDNIKGILYVKDLLPHLNKLDSFRWQSLVRQAYFVPSTKRIDDLLEEFRANKNHMAIVVDEYGGTMGLLTMEDILEEIVGDISDEYDEETKCYTLAPDGSYLFEGKTTLEEFIKITGVPESDFEAIAEDVDTLAGLMLEVKGDFPKRKEVVLYKHYTFQTEEMNKRRIVKVRFVPPKKGNGTIPNS
ncbi:MAG: gliding motility-associated protein GldE [Dysgonamonadaceae bacterium]|nr:gliding motility-associated protein GldE [Dysgonamonadaceae bacterium]